MNKPIWMPLEIPEKRVVSAYREGLKKSRALMEVYNRIYYINQMNRHPLKKISVPSRLYRKKDYSVLTSTVIPFLCEMADCQRFKNNNGMKIVYPTNLALSKIKYPIELENIYRNGFTSFSNYDTYGRHACENCLLGWLYRFPNIDYRPPTAINVRQLYDYLRMSCSVCIFTQSGKRFGTNAQLTPNPKHPLNQSCKVFKIWKWIYNHPEIQKLLTDEQIKIIKETPKCGFSEGCPLATSFAKDNDGYELFTEVSPNKRVPNRLIHGDRPRGLLFGWNSVIGINAWYGHVFSGNRRCVHSNSFPIIREKDEVWLYA